jgi:hypothetical protein
MGRDVSSGEGARMENGENAARVAITKNDKRQFDWRFAERRDLPE